MTSFIVSIHGLNGVPKWRHSVGSRDDDDDVDDDGDGCAVGVGAHEVNVDNNLSVFTLYARGYARRPT